MNNRWVEIKRVKNGFIVDSDSNCSIHSETNKSVFAALEDAFAETFRILCPEDADVLEKIVIEI